MNISTFELSIRKKLDISELSIALSHYFSVLALKVLECDEFWDLPEAEQEKAVGVRLELTDVG